MLKILYVYDLENWAIHNVGKFWLNNNSFYVEFIEFNKIKNIKEIYDFFDFVWFGFQALWEKTNYYCPKKTIITIHHIIDNLKNYQLYKLSNIITTDLNTFEKLKNNNIIADLIPTTSFLDLRDKKEIKKEELKIIAVSSYDKRKNINKIKELFEMCEKQHIKNKLKLGNTILNTQEYQEMFDNYNMFICLSSVEGGPIPAFDAMKRGCSIISTKVGQIQELIINDFNGFLLNSVEDVFEKILWINKNPEWLYNTRLNSLETIKKERNEIEIKDKVNKFLKKMENKNEIKSW